MLDYEDARSHSITISLNATGQGDAPDDVTFTLEVTNRPVSIAFEVDNFMLIEGFYAQAQELSSITLSGDDNPANLTFTTDDNRFEVRGDAATGYALYLKEGMMLDYETEEEIDVKVTSSGDGVDNETFTLQVTNRPISLALETQSAPLQEGLYDQAQELSPITLSGDDSIANMTFITDDNRFEVRGDEANGFALYLRENAIIDHETEAQITVNVSSSDVGSNNESFTLHVTNRPVSFAFAKQSPFLVEGLYSQSHELSLITLSDDVTPSSIFNITTNDNRFEVGINNDGHYALYLKEGTDLDYETEEEITVNVSSTGDGSDEETLTLDIINYAVQLSLDDTIISLDEGTYDSGYFLTNIALDGDHTRASDFSLSLSNDYLFSVRLNVISGQYELWLNEGIELDYEMTQGELNQDRHHRVEIISPDDGLAYFNLNVVNEPEASILSHVDLPLDNHRIDWLFSESSWSPLLGQGVEIDYSFINIDDSDVDGIDIPLGELTNASQALKESVAHSFSLFEQVSNLTFKEVPDNADGHGFMRIGIVSNPDIYGALAYYPYPGSQGNAGNIWLQQNYGQYNNAANLKNGSYAKSAITHEIGHAVGLSHPQDNYRTFDVRILGRDDNNTTHTIMAYAEAWHDKVGSGSDNDTHGPTSLMINDILALQYLYGANNEWARGDDLYHFGGRASADDVLHETIWDTGGVDEFSWQGQSSSARINLNQGSLSFFGAITALDSPLLTQGDFGEGTGIVGIAFKTIIENATGGDGDDHLISNDVANRLDGGKGIDAASYEVSDEAVTVDLSSSDAQQGGYAAGDTLINIENLIGSDFNDNLTGDNGRNHIYGGGGGDNLNGGDHDDRLHGGDGDDTLYGGKGIDQLYSGDGIDELYGEDGNDTLFGYGGVNILNGGRGDDNIFADSGRAIMTGGAGNDVFAISHIAYTIENACVITDFHFAIIDYRANSYDENADFLDLTAIIDALWIDQTRSVNTGQDSNDSDMLDTVLYADEFGEEVVVILEDFTNDIAEIMSDSSIELYDFNPVII